MENRKVILAIVAAVLLGVLVTWTSIVSSPSLPPKPTQAYDPVKQPFGHVPPAFRQGGDLIGMTLTERPRSLSN